MTFRIFSDFKEIAVFINKKATAGPVNQDRSDIEDLQKRVREGLSRLKGLDTGEELGVEILSRLVEGRKTATEIVQLIYGLRSDDQGFKTTYGRVMREIRNLESKGLVSRRLLGRDKPYRLTNYAVANLARIGGDNQQSPLVPWFDLTIYTATIILTLTVASRTAGWLDLMESTHVIVFATLCFLLGASCVELIRTLGRVF